MGSFPRVTHPCATMAEATVRLACVRHAASVRSEPGSNSQVQTGPRPKPETRSTGRLISDPYPSVDTVYLSCFRMLQASGIAPSPNRTGPSARRSLSQPPPAHPFSQHGMHLSKIPPDETTGQRTAASLSRRSADRAGLSGCSRRAAVTQWRRPRRWRGLYGPRRTSATAFFANPSFFSSVLPQQ